ncbi:hypothetical protein BC835DRAFT_701138 [Cytidiella melzeri]|nr:hypothetical protein BC835DRAFT_701138 [Cytidiella melzeri]
MKRLGLVPVCTYLISPCYGVSSLGCIPESRGVLRCRLLIRSPEALAEDVGTGSHPQAKKATQWPLQCRRHPFPCDADFISRCPMSYCSPGLLHNAHIAFDMANLSPSPRCIHFPSFVKKQQVLDSLASSSISGILVSS